MWKCLYGETALICTLCTVKWKCGFVCIRIWVNVCVCVRAHVRLSRTWLSELYTTLHICNFNCFFGCQVACLDGCIVIYCICNVTVPFFHVSMFACCFVIVDLMAAACEVQNHRTHIWHLIRYWFKMDALYVKITASVTDFCCIINWYAVFFVSCLSCNRTHVIESYLKHHLTV